MVAPIIIGDWKQILVTNLVTTKKKLVSNPAVIKKFQPPTLQWQKVFGHQTYDDQRIPIVTPMATKYFWSPSFPCHNVALPFTLNNVWRKKKNDGDSNISSCKNIIFIKIPKKETKILQDITTLSLIPSFKTSSNIILSSYKNRPTT